MMPPGQRGRGKGRRRQRRGISRFLEPCLLLLLRVNGSHGYELAEALASFGLAGIDSSLVYRALREMEDADWVRSEWDAESSGGPARRIYHLTRAGNHHLSAWVADLREIDRTLHHFLETYDRQVSKDDNPDN